MGLTDLLNLPDFGDAVKCTLKSENECLFVPATLTREAYYKMRTWQTMADGSRVASPWQDNHPGDPRCPTAPTSFKSALKPRQPKPPRPRGPKLSKPHTKLLGPLEPLTPEQPPAPPAPTPAPLHLDSWNECLFVPGTPTREAYYKMRTWQRHADGPPTVSAWQDNYPGDPRCPSGHTAEG